MSYSHTRGYCWIAQFQIHQKKCLSFAAEKVWGWKKFEANELNTPSWRWLSWFPDSIGFISLEGWIFPAKRRQKQWDSQFDNEYFCPMVELVTSFEASIKAGNENVDSSKNDFNEPQHERLHRINHAEAFEAFESGELWGSRWLWALAFRVQSWSTHRKQRRDNKW